MRRNYLRILAASFVLVASAIAVSAWSARKVIGDAIRPSPTAVVAIDDCDQQEAEVIAKLAQKFVRHRHPALELSFLNQRVTKETARRYTVTGTLSAVDRKEPYSITIAIENGKFVEVE